MRESQYTPFGGKNTKEGSGSSIPTHLTFVKDVAENWVPSEHLTPGDGTECFPDIQAMCAGHPSLADKLVDMPWDELNAVLEQNMLTYLKSTELYHPDAQ